MHIDCPRKSCWAALWKRTQGQRQLENLQNNSGIQFARLIEYFLPQEPLSGHHVATRVEDRMNETMPPFIGIVAV
jgi:hypothetical protein